MFDEQPDGDPHGECAEEIRRLMAELDQCACALPGPIYMDPPDGGSASVSEQLKRMAKDAARYRWLRDHAEAADWEMFGYQDIGHTDAAIDAAMGRRLTEKDMNKEQAYDEQIAPLIAQIIEVAKEHGIAMFASFMIPNDEDTELCCTTHLPDGDGNFRPEYTRAHADIHGRPAPLHLRTEHGDGSVTMTAIL